MLFMLGSFVHTYKYNDTIRIPHLWSVSFDCLVLRCLSQNGKWGTRPVQVIKVPKSGGVVARDKDERRGQRNRRLKDYFYGYSHARM